MLLALTLSLVRKRLGSNDIRLQQRSSPRRKTPSKRPAPYPLPRTGTPAQWAGATDASRRKQRVRSSYRGCRRPVFPGLLRTLSATCIGREAREKNKDCRQTYSSSPHKATAASSSPAYPPCPAIPARQSGLRTSNWPLNATGLLHPPRRPRCRRRRRWSVSALRQTSPGLNDN